MHVADLVFGRLGHLDYDVGLAVDALYDRRPGLLVVRIQVVVAARARLDDNLETILDEPAYGLRHEPDAALALGYLPWYPYFHAPDYSVGTRRALPKSEPLPIKFRFVIEMSPM